VYAWKLGLVALALMPIQVCAGYARFVMQKKLTQSLRKAYARSADIACEQVAAIRTVVSLNREPRILEEFEQSLKQPVHDAMMKTLKSTGVCVLMMKLMAIVLFAFFGLYVFFDFAFVLVWEYVVGCRRVWYYSILCRVQSHLKLLICRFMSITIGGNNAGQLVSFAGDIMKAKLGAISVTRLLERVPKIDSWSQDGQRIDTLERGHIIFKDVHFRYPTRFARTWLALI
jgi:ATP-binding cassette, subfamily B (MDR/TAP), member 1